MAGSVVGVCIAAAFVVPALGASDPQRAQPRRAPALARVAGGFTPSAADPKMAALFARSGLDGANFRFTPSDSRNASRAVTVAVRTRATQGRDATRVAVVNTATVGIAPIAYNLGVAVGWKRFAVSGDVAKIDLGVQPGSREAADVAVTYAGNRLSGQVKASADRGVGSLPRTLVDVPSYSIDVGGSYALTRRLDLTAGMRYKSERERLTRISDDRRDSQAVYVGTAFRF